MLTSQKKHRQLFSCRDYFWISLVRETQHLTSTKFMTCLRHQLNHCHWILFGMASTRASINWQPHTFACPLLPSAGPRAEMPPSMPRLFYLNPDPQVLSLLGWLLLFLYCSSLTPTGYFFQVKVNKSFLLWEFMNGFILFYIPVGQHIWQVS